MVANNPKFRFEPREESDEKQVKKMSTLIDYQLDRMDFLKKFKMWVKDALIYGTGYIRCYWRVDAKDQYNDPDIDNVDILEFYPDPKAAEVDGGDFVIHRTVVGLDALERQKTPTGEPLYQNLKFIRMNNTADLAQQMLYVNNKSMSYGEINTALPNMGSPFIQSFTKQVEVLEYWGVNPEDESNEWVITIANRSTVIRAEKNPYGNRRPFVKLHVDPMAHTMNGKGIIEPIEYLQLELNDTRNQRMDNVNLILNKLFVVRKDGDVDETELISRPGGVIYEGIPNAVRVLETPDVTQSAYQEEALIKQDAQNAVGVSDIIQGQLSSASENVPGQVLNKTATGAQIAVQQTGSRFKYYMQNIEDALREFGEILYEYNQEFLSEEKIIRVNAPNDYQKVQKAGLINKIKGFIGLPQENFQQYEFERVKPEEVRQLKLDVKVDSGSTQPVDDIMKQSKAQGLLQMLGGLPVTTPDTFIALAEQILDAYQVPNKTKIMQTLQAPQAAPSQDQNVRVSLSGQLNPFQVADIAKKAGVSDAAADPALAAQLMANEQSDSINQGVGGPSAPMPPDAGMAGNGIPPEGAGPI